MYWRRSDLQVDLEGVCPLDLVAMAVIGDQQALAGPVSAAVLWEGWLADEFVAQGQKVLRRGLLLLREGA